MAVPTPLHYWLVRLQVLRRRRVWATGLGFLVLGWVGYQYFNHPEWLQGFVLDEEDRARPAAEADLSNLSQAELADLAEIDNLALLLNQLQPLTAQALAEETTTPQPAAALALPSPTVVAPLRSTDGSNPFAPYLERTQFRVGSLAATPDPAATEASRPSGLRLPPGELSSGELSSGETATNPATNPLQRLLRPNGDAASAPDDPASRSPEDTVANERLSPTASTGLTPPPWVVEGATPGINQPFIRTTPEMSPPPGTTGYAPPPSLVTPPRQGLPTVPATPGLPPAPQLNLSPSPTAPAALAAPSPSGVGNTLPPSTVNTYTQPAAGVPEAAPFSVPRPPGSYTGGGYINTFSDPSGPVD